MVNQGHFGKSFADFLCACSYCANNGRRFKKIFPSSLSVLFYPSQWNCYPCLYDLFHFLSCDQLSYDCHVVYRWCCQTIWREFRYQLLVLLLHPLYWTNRVWREILVQFWRGWQTWRFGAVIFQQCPQQQTGCGEVGGSEQLGCRLRSVSVRVGH